MDDLISRKAAIDALAKFVPYAICDASTESYTNGLTDAYNLICQLPSAQPEQRSFSCGQENDLISRRAAIDKLDPIFESLAIDKIKALPTALPEIAKRIVGKSKDGMTLWYQCDMCNEPVDAQDNFCRGCGRRLTDG